MKRFFRKRPNKRISNTPLYSRWYIVYTVFALVLLSVPAGILKSQTMIPIPPHTQVYSDPDHSRGFWFTAPTDFVITGARVPADAGTGVQNIAIVKYNSPISTTCRNPDAVLGYWTNVPPNNIVPANILVQSGDIIGILGTRGTSTSNMSYGTGTTFASSILGVPVTLRRFGMQENLNANIPGCCQSWNTLPLARVEVYYAPVATDPNDAGIISINSPLDFCPGINQVDVTLINLGTNQLTSATINWSVNGVVQTPVNWTGLLDITDVTTRTTQVTLGSFDFLANTPYTIRAWTSNPNGATDPNPGNDAFEDTRKSSFSGTYTIGGTSPDYPSFTSAIADLVANGLCGSVVFKVRAGTYDEQISIPEIVGSSSVNTVTFESESGINNDVNITYGATSSGSNYVVEFDGCDYVTFKNMTVTATGSSYTRVITVVNEATHNTFESLVLNGRNVSNTSTNYAVIYSNDYLDDFNTFRHCEINNGSYGMYWYGDGTSSLETGTVIENNTFTGQYNYGMRVYYQNAPVVRNNSVSITSTTTAYGIYAGYGDNQLLISGNNVLMNSTSGTKYGIYLYYCDGVAGNEALVSNNMVTINNGSSTSYGIYSNESDKPRFYNNTSYTSSTSTSGRAFYGNDGEEIKLKNNIFYNAGNGYAVYTNNTGNIVESDYNLFYTNGAEIGHWDTDVITMADWQNLSGKDANSVNKAVSFVNTSSGDLHLAGASTNDLDLVGQVTAAVLKDYDDEFRVYPYMGADESLTGVAQNDAGISAIVSPDNFCAGVHPVIVTLRNFGSEPLTSVTIEWTWNGVPQPAFSWTGLLDNTDLTTRTTQVTIATEQFNAGLPHDISAWTTMPNGVADPVSSNDATTVSRRAAISGDVTIGPGGSYPTFSDAVSDMETYGLCGPVVFKVLPGVYNEQVTIRDIPGVSSTNTITFESENGNRSSVNLTYAATGTGNNFVLKYDGCDYVTFRDMTLTATGNTYARVIDVGSGSDYCTFENLNLVGTTGNRTGTNAAVMHSGSNTTNNYTTIRGCLIQNGSYGIYWNGGSSNLEVGTVIENNTIENFYDDGAYISYQDGLLFDSNTLTSTSTGTQYILYPRYCDNQLQITRNKIYVNSTSGTKHGIRMYYCDATPGSEGLVANNFVYVSNGSSTCYGIYSYYSDYQKYYFNTVYVNNTSTSARSMYSNYGDDISFSNNIFYNAGAGYAWYNTPTSASNVLASDYNLLFTNGANIAYWGGSARATLADLQTASGFDANSITKDVSFADPDNGDLHLTGTSRSDVDLIGSLQPEVTDDIDGEPRYLPNRGADEACYIAPNTVSIDMVDATGYPVGYANIPGMVGVRYYVSFPEFAATITITVNFYKMPENVFAGSQVIMANKAFGIPLDGYTMIPLDGLSEGLYRIEPVFHTKNSCDGYQIYIAPNEAFMLYPQGQQPCVVWPGDVNNDGLVNYGDRKSLNTYIHDSNLDPTWLYGPKRYRADSDPLSALRWEPQPATPWATPEGCYMDADGNGVVNSFDYISMKINWMRAHLVATPKQKDEYNAESFEMSQNYPNPFNPSTRISYSVPERSQVRIVVTDMLGQEIATLMNDVVDAGVRTLTFNANAHASGNYIAIATMQGLETGMTFTKAIRMTLSK